MTGVWSVARIVGGGTRWTLRGEEERRLVTVVRLPGTLFRAYWDSERVSDHTSAEYVLAAVRDRFPNVDVPALPEAPAPVKRGAV